MESFILEIKDYFNDFIWEQIKLAISVAGPVMETFKYVAFILVLAKIARNLYQNPSDWWGYVSWLPLCLLLFQYEMIVQFFVELSASADKSVSYASNHRTYMKLFKTPEVPDQSDIGLFDMTVAYMNQMMRNQLELLISIQLMNLVSLASMIIYIFLKIKAMLRFIVLVFFGPLSISISFLPGNEFQWLDWVLKLLETAMFIPMLMFIDYLGLQVLEKAFKPIVPGEIMTIGDQNFQMWLGIFFFALLGVSYLFVPSMVKWGIAKANSGVGGSKKAAAAAAMAARKIMTKGLG